MQKVMPNKWNGLTYGILSGLILFAVTLLIGMHYASMPIKVSLWRVLSLIGTSIVLGAQPAALASLALGFHPFLGGVISILANLIPVPILMLALNQVLSHWTWLHKQVMGIQQWSRKSGQHGVAYVALLSPFIGSYVCIAIGDGLGWSPSTTLLATFSTTILSVFLITYGEHWVLGLFPL